MFFNLLPKLKNTIHKVVLNYQQNMTDETTNHDGVEESKGVGFGARTKKKAKNVTAHTKLHHLEVV